MFREMRLKKQLLSESETIGILETCTAGVLAVAGDEDYPYAVPISYAYKDGKLYFHMARSGHKLDGIGRNPKVSFCVIQLDEVQPAAFTTHYRSAIAFGRARILTEDSEIQSAMECLSEKYSPGYLAEGRREIMKEWKNFTVVELTIEHLTGKTASEIIDNNG
jgi:nitroimidazol reductase NimA-like FMN-containing flavoprotein (pyridoxamine 5'-phosphate oxidase superfamily)